MLTNGDNPSIDWEKIRDTVHLAVRFLDNVIDVNHFPLKQIEEMTRANRKIGLGVMGFADMLIALGIPYDSNDALQTAERVMKFISDEATAASVKLAEDRGVFPSFSGSIYDRPGGPRLRNATLTTIAPTGTLSIIAGCSSGIEPLFALAYRRETRLAAKDEDGNPNGEYFVYNEVNHAFEERAKRDGFYSEELMEELAQKGRLDGMEGVPDSVKRVFVTAHDVSPEWHVRMQAAFQKYIDNAVSKTINFPHTATRADIEKAYLLAFNLGCKGITVYRDASREVQILSVPKDGTLSEAKGLGEGEAKASRIMPRTRPTETHGKTVKVSTGCGNLYVTVNSDEEGICEVFSTLGKAGGCAAAQSEAISRLISLTLRSGVEPESVMEQLQGIRCPSISWDQGHAILSCPDALATVLRREIGAGEGQPTMLLEGKAETFAPSTSSNPGLGEAVPNLGGQCPECSSLLVYQEGCFNCRACGYTKCG
jgi:ribonucleoside-diphosphate reductase alpha chain